MTTAKSTAQPATTTGAAKERRKTRAAGGSKRHAIDAQERHALVQRAAYFLAEARGFAPGQELHDWFAAEAAVDAQLSSPR